MKDSNVEYRTTKEILEGIIRNADKYSEFEYKYIYNENTKKMFYCVKKVNEKNIYEVKVTKKVCGENERIIADEVTHNKDTQKEEFLLALKNVVSFVYKRVYSHEGNVLIADNNNDYIISMVKKIGLEWK